MASPSEYIIAFNVLLAVEDEIEYLTSLLVLLSAAQLLVSLASSLVAVGFSGPFHPFFPLLHHQPNSSFVGSSGPLFSFNLILLFSIAFLQYFSYIPPNLFFLFMFDLSKLAIFLAVVHSTLD